MAEKHRKTIEPTRKTEELKTRSPASSLQLLALSHSEFQARWSLAKNSLDSGLRAASGVKDEPRLVLRVYSLPIDSDHADFSDIWHDYSIKKHNDSAFFKLPKPSPKIKAVIGLTNKSGRFIPLVRGHTVDLSPLPDPPPVKHTKGIDYRAARGRDLSYQSNPTNAAHGKAEIN